ncbi:hypothetical protein [Catellatospora vulcania]|uniref:hypothetical protein n=1 Tax=Catellatospora vulcania TaxID=1460450 RepID=UPI0012D41F35|nr:hypothetical protein [Catellatospora vulcania]
MTTPPARDRTRVGNDGDGLLELVLEGDEQDYWLRPGEQAVVVTASAAEAFDVYCAPGRIVVHFDGVGAWVEDVHGAPLAGGHQRPSGWDALVQRKPTQSLAQRGSE